MQIDHVVLGVNDLAAASARLSESYGLDVLPGGTHRAWGTRNAIVPAGRGQYLELLAVDDPTVQHPLPGLLTALVRDGDRPLAVCMRPADLDAVAGRLGLTVAAAERVSDSGGTLRWRLAGLSAAFGPDRLPFFIDWAGTECNPEVAAAPGDGLAWVEVGGSVATLRTWLGEVPEQVRLVGGPAGLGRVAVRRGDDTLIIGS